VACHGRVEVEQCHEALGKIIDQSLTEE
jgi:hypothetical protein